MFHCVHSQTPVHAGHTDFFGVAHFRATAISEFMHAWWRCTVYLFPRGMVLHACESSGGAYSHREVRQGSAMIEVKMADNDQIY